MTDFVFDAKAYPPGPEEAPTFYHATKPEALAAGAPYEELFLVRAQFEPNNGWVCVLGPKDRACFDIPFNSLLDRFELDLLGLGRLAKAPASKKRMPSEEEVKQTKRAKPEPVEEVAPTWTPGSKLPW